LLIPIDDENNASVNTLPVEKGILLVRTCMCLFLCNEWNNLVALGSSLSN
jgi:hypothetical protein